MRTLFNPKTNWIVFGSFLATIIVAWILQTRYPDPFFWIVIAHGLLLIGYNVAGLAHFAFKVRKSGIWIGEISRKSD